MLWFPGDMYFRNYVYTKVIYTFFAVSLLLILDLILPFGGELYYFIFNIFSAIVIVCVNLTTADNEFYFQWKRDRNSWRQLSEDYQELLDDLYKTKSNLRDRIYELEIPLSEKKDLLAFVDSNIPFRSHEQSEPSNAKSEVNEYSIAKE